MKAQRANKVPSYHVDVSLCAGRSSERVLSWARVHNHCEPEIRRPKRTSIAEMLKQLPYQASATNKLVIATIADAIVAITNTY